MPDQLQLRGGTTSEHNSFTGVTREVTVDTTKKTLVVHDGSTAGGTPLMKEGGTVDPSNINFGTGGTTAVTIDSNRNVGIGIASPNTTTKLHIAAPQTGSAGGTGLTMSGWNGSAEARVQLMSFGVGGGTFAIRSGTSNTERLRMDQSGNFGISRSSPVHKFDVNGNIRGTLGRFGSGTASEPAYSFHSDSNTGMYHSGTDMLSFATGGTDRVIIDGSGNTTIRGGSSIFFHNGFNDSTSRIQNHGSSNNSTLRFLTRLSGTESEKMVITAGGSVGIGVTGPSGACKLEIGGKLMFSGLDTAFVSSARPAIFRSGSTSGSYPFNAFGHLVLQTRGDGSNRDIVFATGTNGANKSVINAAGNLGVGTTSPATKLHLSSAGDTIARVTSADGYAAFLDLGDASDPDGGRIHYDSGSNTVFSTASSERMRINGSGYVGIGTTNPIFRLDVGNGVNDPANGRQFRINGAGDYILALQRQSTPSFSIRNNATAVVHLNTQNSKRLALGVSTGNTSGSIEQHLNIISNGNVGIGSASPAVRLVINGGSGGGGVAELFRLDTTGNSNGDGSALTFSRAGTVRTQISSIKNETANNETDIAFSTTLAGSLGEKMRIDSSGRVAIGHNSPSSFSSSANTLVVHEATGNSGISINAASANALSSIFFTDGTGSGANGVGRLSYQHNDDSLAIWTNAGEKMRINSSGHVGIGTGVPNKPLHIYNGSNDSEIRLHTNNGTDRSAYVSLRASSGDLDLYSVTGAIKLHCENVEGFRLMKNGSHKQAYLNTTTQLAGSTLSIHTNGTCGIGLKVGADNTQKMIAFANTNGEVGSITTNGSATSFNTSSDYRLKENAVAIADGISRLKTLIPYRFNFKSDASTKVDGFFAHEVTAVPEAVTGTKDQVDSDNNPVYQGIDQSKLVPLLVAAVKELIGKVETLEAAA